MRIGSRHVGCRRPDPDQNPKTLLRANEQRNGRSSTQPQRPTLPKLRETNAACQNRPRVACLTELRSFECRVCGIVVTADDTRMS